jgi:hypothetical protein
MLKPFLPNPDADEEIMADDELRSGLADHAEPAAELAKNFAPVYEGEYNRPGESYREPGSYRDSIQVIETDEGEVYLAATDWKAHWIEYGSVHNPVLAPLRRGAEGAGLNIAEADL